MPESEKLSPKVSRIAANFKREYPQISYFEAVRLAKGLVENKQNPIGIKKVRRTISRVRNMKAEAKRADDPFVSVAIRRVLCASKKALRFQFMDRTTRWVTRSRILNSQSICVGDRQFTAQIQSSMFVKITHEYANR